MPPLLVTAMMETTTPEQTSQMMSSNLIISNVRGSDKPMYIAGARLETMYPMSIITPGMGVNFTCVSYSDQVDIGVAIEPQLVPDSWDIIDGLHRALDEYMELLPKVPRRRKSSAKSGRAGVAGKSSAAKRTPAKKKSTPGKKGSTARAKAKAIPAKKRGDRPASS